MNFASLPPRLDAARERLLAARMTTLHRCLPSLASSELPKVTADLIGVIGRLFDPSTSSDLLDARELDADYLIIAEHIISESLALPDFSPTMIAERLQVSRATLYRIFAPVGGVMQRVWSMRLEAVRAALEQPSKPLTMSRLAAAHGFKSAAHLSRSFRAQNGVSPREWCARAAARSTNDWQDGSARLNEWWHEPGR